MKPWKEVRLGKYVKIKHGFAFKGEYFNDRGEFILLTPGNVHPKGGLKLKGQKETYYTGNIPPEYILNKGDLVVVMTDLTQDASILGGAMLLDKSNLYLHNQRMGLISHSDEIDRQFLYQYLNWQFFRDQVKASSNGATVKHTSPSRIYQCRMFLPPCPIQRKVAAILSAYDELIENNQRRISLLEKMAEEIYREWFVRLRFPGHEKVKVVKGVPEGWRPSCLGKVAKFTMGQSPSSEFYNKAGDGLPFHQGVGTYGERFPQTINYCSEDGRRAHKGDILFSVRAPVGRLNIADREMIIGRGLAALRHKKERNSYLYYLLKTAFANEDIIGNGSIFNSVGKDELTKFPIFEPEPSLVEKFEEIASKIDEQITVLIYANECLKSSHDALLPRLISGKLSVENLDIQFPPGMAAETKTGAANA